jgi:hypothetical protein
MHILIRLSTYGRKFPCTEDGVFETVFHTGKLFVPVELGMGDEAGMVVEKSEQKDLARFVRVGGVGDLGAVHGIALPQVAKVVALEATVGLGALFAEELRGGGVSSRELATEGA